MQEPVKSIRKRNLNLWLSHEKTATRILLSVSLSLVILLLFVVFIFGQRTFDESAFKFIAPHITDGRTDIMNFISFLGKHSFLIPIIFTMILVALFMKKFWMAIRITLVLITSLLLMSLLKRLLHRPRPSDPLVEGITNFSFPSGHAFMAVAFYGLLVWMSAVYITKTTLQRLLIALFICIILSIAFSRVYLRVHYATDVIAGLSIGFIWLSFCLWVIDKREFKTKEAAINAGTQTVE